MPREFNIAALDDEPADLDLTVTEADCLAAPRLIADLNPSDWHDLGLDRPFAFAPEPAPYDLGWLSRMLRRMGRAVDPGAGDDARIVLDRDGVLVSVNEMIDRAERFAIDLERLV